jgi:hypothetical protein
MPNNMFRSIEDKKWFSTNKSWILESSLSNALNQQQQQNDNCAVFKYVWG